MTAKCMCCKRYWNISVLKRIPKKGYICPYCTDKPKKYKRRNKLCKPHQK